MILSALNYCNSTTTCWTFRHSQNPRIAVTQLLLPPFSQPLAVSCQSHRLQFDRQPHMVMTRPRSRPVSRLLAVSRQLHRLFLDPQLLMVMIRPRSRPFSRLLAVSCQSHRLPLDRQPRMLMTRPRSRPVSRLLAVSRQSHRFHLSPQFLLRLFSLSMQNYRMLPSLSDALFSFLVTLVISVISSFAVLCIVSGK